MTRVLVLSPERIRARMAGMAIRALEVASALARAGHDVRLACPGGVSDGIVRPGVRALDAFSPELAATAAASDLAVVSGHALGFLPAAFGGAVVADLYDPFPVENLAYGATLGPGVLENDRRALLGLLERADLILAASEEQRLFYMGALFARELLDGNDVAVDPEARGRVDVAPFGVSDEEPGPAVPEPSIGASPHDVLFGGVYDWYDPDLALDAWPFVLADVPDARLVLSENPNPESTPQTRFAGALRRAEDAGWLGASVRVIPWAPWASRGGLYRSFRAAVVAHRPSLESRLSFRTRVLDFLWAGLPVAATECGAASALVGVTGAGIVVPPEPRALARALVSLLTDDALALAASGSGRTAARRFRWDDTLAPLLRFAASPSRRAQASSPPALWRRVARRLKA